MKRLTKSQYEVVANTMRYTKPLNDDLHEGRGGLWAYIVMSLADDLSALDTEFDRKKFYELCGGLNRSETTD